MTTTIDRHAQCLELLPAFLGGTSTSSEATMVIAHTAECAECRAELATARRLHGHFERERRGAEPLCDDLRDDLLNDLLDESSEQAGFDRLWARITAESSAMPPRSKPRDWFRPLTALAATLLLGAGYAWYQAAATPQYRTLADPARTCVALRVQFVPQTPPNDATKALEEAGAREINGPNAQGIYTLHATNPVEAVHRLRALPEVQLAEPADC